MTGPADNGINSAKLLNRRVINNDRVVINSEKVYRPTSAVTDKGFSETVWENDSYCFVHKP